MLSTRQTQIYQYIKQFVSSNGRAPTLEQISQSVGLKSVSTVHEHLKVIEEAGLIYRPDNKKRNIKLTGEQKYQDPSGTIIPVIGSLVAASPIRPIEEFINLSSPQILKKQPVYALRVDDEHLQQDHILKHDYIIYTTNYTAKSGDPIIVKLANEAVLIKRYFFESRIHHLYPLTRKDNAIKAANFHIIGQILHILRNP